MPFPVVVGVYTTQEKAKKQIKLLRKETTIFESSISEITLDEMGNVDCRTVE